MRETMTRGELRVIADTDHVQCGDAAAMANMLLELLGGWIKCSERMPDSIYVVAADFSGKQYPANLPNIQIGIYADWFADGNPSWDDGDGNDLRLKQVTHWMPLPAAPDNDL